MTEQGGNVAFIGPVEEDVLRRCKALLRERSMQCGSYRDRAALEEALRDPATPPVDVAIIDVSDLSRDTESAVERVRRLRSDDAQVDVVVLGSNPTAEGILSILSAGAAEFREADSAAERPEDLCHLLEQICAEHRLSEDQTKRIRGTEPGAFIGRSPGILRAVTQASKVIAEDAVLFQGESGAGKSFLARTLLEELNPERGEHFERVDCGALADSLMEAELFGWEPHSFTGAGEKERQGLFEMADGGTLFLDEIGNLALPHQKTLLMALESEPGEPFKKTFRKVGQRKITVDVQLIAATQYDLEKMVESEEFLEALYHRICRYRVHVPPLRDRKEDIRYIAERLLLAASKRMAKKFCRISAEAAGCLQAYPWPGNVRELSNVINSAVRTHRGTVLEAEQLPPRVRNAQDVRQATAVFGEELVRLRTRLDEEEMARLADEFGSGSVRLPDGNSALLADVIPRERANKSRLARRLGISRQTLYGRLKDQPERE